MVLEKDEYRIEGDGIWISKAALEECRDHYCKIADKYKPKKGADKIDFHYGFYLGKCDVCVEMLQCFDIKGRDSNEQD